MLKMKRIISLILALVLLVGMVPPMAVRADETEPVTETEPAVVTEVTEATEATELTEPAETTEASEATEAAGSTETTEATETTEPAETTEVTEVTEVTEPSEPTEPDSSEPVEEAEPEDPMAPVNMFKNLPETARITKWIQQDYGFDLIETDYASYKEQHFAEIAQSGDVETFAAAALPTPQNVLWSTDTYGMLTMTFPQNVNLSTVEVAVTIFLNGEFYRGGTWWLEGTYEKDSVLMLDFVPRILDGGTYTATVQLVSRSGNSAGGTASSNSWNFTLPSYRLSTPSNLRWEGDRATWNPVSNARGYYVHWNSQYGNVSGSWMYDITDLQPSVSFGVPTENSGLTKFTVQALADLKYYQHSYESDWSEYNGTAVETDKTMYNGVVQFNSEISGKKQHEVNLVYYDSFFSESSYTYNHDLAKASLKLAMSAFATNIKRKGGKDGDAQNAYDYLTKIGCKEEHIKDYGYDKQPEGDSIAYVIGSKYLKDEDTHLVIVAIRGQGYGAEWGGNFRVGPGIVYHQGFEKAMKQVLGGLNLYIGQSQHLSGNIKLWITGYSRAGGTANLLAGTLINGESNLHPKVKLAAEDLFTYTFEAPAGVKGSGFPKTKQYKNIFNIVNETDFVPKVAPELWGFERFGVDYFLPDMSKKDNAAVVAKYKELIGSNYIEPFEANFFQARQSVFLDLAISKLSTLMGGEAGYFATLQQTLYTNCVIHKGLPKLEVLLNLVLTGLALTNLDVIDVILENKDEVKFSHRPENCLAVVETMTGEGDYALLSKYKYYIVKCPVDVTVTDNAGSVIAVIENDAVTHQGNENVDVYVDGNGEKYVFVLDDSEYNLQLTATDNGEMDCTVVTWEKGSGKESQSAFFDVPLVDGESYDAALSVNNDAYQLIGVDAVYTPDVTVSGDALNNTPVSVNVIGGGVTAGSGKYTLGDTADLTAAADDGYIFAGWYQDGHLITRDEHYSFSVRETVDLTAVFLSTDVTISLDREYLAVQCEPGQTVTEQLKLSLDPEEWAEFVSWSVDATEENANVLTVDENGTVTVQEPGIAYVVATASFKGHTFSTRCRFDVTGESIEEQLQEVQEQSGISGVQLDTLAVTAELYSADYAKVPVMLLLPQNMPLQSIAKETPADNGAAIESAYFTDPAVAELFELSVKDDRTLLVVPTQAALTQKISGKFSSSVAVMVEGTEFVTLDALKLAVKQTLPKLKCSAVTLNPFYQADSAMLNITGGVVTGVQAENCPEWLSVDADGVISLTEGAPKTGSAKVQLLVDVEGYIVPAAVTANVKLAKKAPVLKLAASTITILEDHTFSQGISMQLITGKRAKTIEELGVVSVTAPDGYSVENLNPADGSFLLVPQATPEKKTIQLNVRLSGATEDIPLNVKVKVAPVQIKLGTNSLNLGYAVPYSVPVSVKVTPADYLMQNPVIRITDKSGNTDFTDSDILECRYESGMLYVGSTEYTWSFKGDTYKVWISPHEGAKETALTVKIPAYSKTAISYKVKASGAIDLSFPGSQVVLTPTLKNYAIQGTEDIGYSVRARYGKGDYFDVTDLFTLTPQGDGTLAISEKTPGTLDAKCTYSIWVSMITESLYQMVAPEIKLPVRQTAVKLKLDASKISLNKDLDDVTKIGVTCITKGYAFDLEKAVLSYDAEKLNIQRVDGQLVIGLESGAEYGKTYSVEVRACTGAPAAKLKVAVLKANVIPKSVIKATGVLDVIREGTAIKVTPTYTNVLNVDVDNTAKLKIYSSENNYESPVNEVTAKDGVFVIDTSVISNSSYKYKAQLETNLYGPENPVKSKMISLNVRMGKAKLTVKTSDTILFAKDKYDRAQILFEAKDTSLNNVARITFMKAAQADQFEIIEYGDNQFAIGFKNANVDKNLVGKSVTVALNVFIEGNQTAKANATANVKLTIIK